MAAGRDGDDDARCEEENAPISMTAKKEVESSAVPVGGGSGGGVVALRLWDGFIWTGGLFPYVVLSKADAAGGNDKAG